MSQVNRKALIRALYISECVCALRQAQKFIGVLRHSRIGKSICGMMTELGKLYTIENFESIIIC